MKVARVLESPLVLFGRLPVKEPSGAYLHERPVHGESAHCEVRLEVEECRLHREDGVTQLTTEKRGPCPTWTEKIMI